MFFVSRVEICPAIFRKQDGSSAKRASGHRQGSESPQIPRRTSVEHKKQPRFCVVLTRFGAVPVLIPKPFPRSFWRAVRRQARASQGKAGHPSGSLRHSPHSPLSCRPAPGHDIRKPRHRNASGDCAGDRPDSLLQYIFILWSCLHYVKFSIKQTTNLFYCIRKKKKK